MSKGTLKADSDLMNELHQMIAQDLIKRLKAKDCTIQEVAAAIKFLKDNDVTADPEFNPPLRQVENELPPVGELPFVEDEDEQVV